MLSYGNNDVETTEFLIYRKQGLIIFGNHARSVQNNREENWNCFNEIYLQVLRATASLWLLYSGYCTTCYGLPMTIVQKTVLGRSQIKSFQQKEAWEFCCINYGNTESKSSKVCLYFLRAKIGFSRLIAFANLAYHTNRKDSTTLAVFERKRT